MQAAIEKAAGEGGRTVIAVAHRLATIQNADVIFVLGSGRVLESGSHSELISKRGVYYQMVSHLIPIPCAVMRYANMLSFSVKLRLLTDEEVVMYYL